MACDSMNALYLFVFESFVNKTVKRIKHLKNSLYSLASSDVMMEFISSRDFFNGNHTATKVTNHGSVLSTFLFLDQSEKSPDSGLATDKYSSNCIRRTFAPRQKI